MRTDEQLLTLYTAIKALKDLPIQKLQENGILLKEIQSVLNSKNLHSIIGGIQKDYRLQKDLEFGKGKENTSSGLTFESDKFLHSYARFQGAAYELLSKGKSVASRFTTPLKKTEALAFNAKKMNPFKTKEIKELKEAKEFAEVFNSIYSDRALQINTQNDPTIISNFIDYSPYSWNYKDYLAIPTLSKTIDLPIQVATRQIPVLDFDDENLLDEMMKALKRLHFNEIVQKMLLYSSLSPRGSLIVPIENDDGTIRFNTFNDTQFTYATSYQYSRIDYVENLTGVSSLYVLGHLIQNEVTGHFLCPGFEPLYAIGKNKIYQLKDAAEAVNIYLYTIKVLCIRAQVLVQNWGGEGQNDTLLQRMSELTADINSSLSLSTAVKIPEGSTLDILNNNINEGFSKVSPIIKEYQGMLSGVMPDYFYGSSTAYAANNFNIHATHQNIRSDIQEAQIEPIYRFAINKMLELDKRFAKWKNRVDDFDIEFQSLYEATSIEKAQLDAIKIQNITTMAGYPELMPIFKREKLMEESDIYPDPVGGLGPKDQGVNEPKDDGAEGDTGGEGEGNDTGSEKVPGSGLAKGLIREE
jgi:hypothetical protein